MVPDLFNNLKHAMLPLMDNKIYETMKEVLSNIDEKSAAKKKSSSDPNGGARKRKRLNKEASLSSKSEGEVASSFVAEGTTCVELDEENTSASGIIGGTKCTANFCAPCFELA